MSTQAALPPHSERRRGTRLPIRLGLIVCGEGGAFARTDSYILSERPRSPRSLSGYGDNGPEAYHPESRELGGKRGSRNPRWSELRRPNRSGNRILGACPGFLAYPCRFQKRSPSAQGVAFSPQRV
jgi:hypothetical protein